jgi:hypothetical protein
MMLCQERRIELESLSARNVAKSDSGQQGTGTSLGEGGVCVAVSNRSHGGHQ